MDNLNELSDLTSENTELYSIVIEFLNAGCKESRARVAKRAKEFIDPLFTSEYKNNNDLSVIDIKNGKTYGVYKCLIQGISKQQNLTKEDVKKLEGLRKILSFWLLA